MPPTARESLLAVCAGVACLTLMAPSGNAQPAKRPPAIEAVVIHPVMGRPFTCREHFEGELEYLFDALGTDCVISVSGRTYRTDGRTNEDYHVWAQAVLAPFDGTVAQVTVNSVVNEPGVMGKSPAGFIVFRRDDGLEVMYAHIDSIVVGVGDSVTAGQPVALVSNNGMSRGPHVHVGAKRGEWPVQIRWDQRAMGELLRERTRRPPE